MKVPEYGKIDLVLWDTYRPGRGQPAHSSTPSINRAARVPCPLATAAAGTAGPRAPGHPPPRPGHPGPATPATIIPRSHRLSPPDPAGTAQCDSPCGTTLAAHGVCRQDQTCTLIIYGSLTAPRGDVGSGRCSPSRAPTLR